MAVRAQWQQLARSKRHYKSNVHSVRKYNPTHSLLLTKDELLRPENNYDTFSTITARAMIKIASFENASVADVLAVCGAVAIEVLSKGRNKVLGVGGKNMRVGRLDSITPAPENQLLPGDAPTSDFANFWVKHG
jgi:hypothetical protein